jgi:hypothetical protein
LWTFRVLAAAGVAAVTLGCTPAPGQSASAPRLTSPSPQALNPADSKAADLRTRLDLLLGEHVIVIAKETSAARRGAEYASYLHLLTSNGNDLTELVRSALGDTAAARFDQIWSAQNDHLVNYTIGLVTHNKSQATAAMSGLATAFVPQFSQFLSTAIQVPQGPIAQLAIEHVADTKAVIDDQVAQNYPKMYSDLHTAYAQASLIGDALGPTIAQKFPDKFPGSASSQAADLRVSVSNLLQENLYLATMATSAAAGGRRSEQAAAVGALAANVQAIGNLFSGLFGASAAAQLEEIWAARNVAMVAYAAASTDGARQSALSQLNSGFIPRFSGFVQDSAPVAPTALGPAIVAQVDSTITVIDDQRLKSLARLAADDRSADASMEVVADLIVSGVVAKLHTRFAS